MKALKFCANNDGNPVCPPSKVICKDCMDEISRKLKKMIADLSRANQSLNPDAEDGTG